MAESGIGYADIGDWHYYSLPLHTLNFKNYEEELLLVLDAEPQYIDEFFTYVINPKELTQDNAIALAELCEDDYVSNNISPVLKDYVENKVSVVLPLSSYTNEEWEEILSFIPYNDADGLNDYLEEMTEWW